MKKIIFFSSFFIFFAVTVSAQRMPPTAKKLWTIAEVQNMAKQYNLQDSVVLPRNAFLVYLNKHSLENYLQRHSLLARANQEWAMYLAKTKDVHTFDEDAKLIDNYPSVRKDIVKMRGGEQAHQDYVASARKYQWRIYRNSDGGLAFFRADEPVKEREFQYGTRIDNLPKD